MNNLVEKSLKRFIKRRITFTLGMMVAFLISSSLGYAATNTPIIVNSGDENITEESLNLELAQENDDSYMHAILVDPDNNGTANLGINVSNDISVVNINNDARGLTVRNGGVANITGKNINIEAISNGKQIGPTSPTAIGINLDNILGPNNKGTGGEITLKGENLNITARATDPTGWAYGIYAITRSTSLTPDKVSVINIDSDNLTITAESATEGQSDGIIAWSQGQVRINNGNVAINADNAINTRGNSLVEINADNKAENSVQINGDIVFEYNNESSGTTIDSDVIINLSNSNSHLVGNIITNSDIDPIPDGKDNVDGMRLGLYNGAQWTTDSSSFVNTLTMSGGIINARGGKGQQIKVEDFTGSGGTINTETEVEESGDLSTGTIDLGSVIGDKPTFDIYFKGITADDIEDIDKVKTVEVITGDTDGIIINRYVEEGLINGDITVDSYGNIIQGRSSTLDRLTNIGAINFLTWRQESSSLNQRMGELRDSQGTSGVWARVYGGKFELDNEFKNEYQTYQVGYDKKYDYAGGKLFLGYLFSYTDGSSNYKLGSGENNSFGVGVYGAWVNSSGHYVDIIAKINRLHNEYDIYADNEARTNSKGDYTNYGISLGAEYGKRFTMDRVFIEPSIRMDLGKVAHRSYTTSSGVRVDQDSIYSALGTLGVKVGYELSKGNIYARVAGVKEFAGDMDMSFKNSKTSKTYGKDFEDEWVEIGVGGNYRVAENVNLYLDLSKTTDAHVDTAWQVNLGFRWEL